MIEEYALIVLDEETEEQERLVSNDYAALVWLREFKRAMGATARLRQADDAAVWDYLQSTVAADVADFLAVTQ
jgi:hypothetical protein